MRVLSGGTFAQQYLWWIKEFLENMMVKRRGWLDGGNFLYWFLGSQMKFYCFIFPLHAKRKKKKKKKKHSIFPFIVVKSCSCWKVNLVMGTNDQMTICLEPWTCMDMWIGFGIFPIWRLGNVILIGFILKEKDFHWIRGLRATRHLRSSMSWDAWGILAIKVVEPLEK